MVVLYTDDGHCKMTETFVGERDTIGVNNRSQRLCYWWYILVIYGYWWLYLILLLIILKYKLMV